MANIKGIELASEVYDLEDTSARDTATTASQTATQAEQTATQASQTATTASETATQASQTATTASETATQASQTATQASQTATQASQTATQASQTATQASQTATQASQTADEANTKIGNLSDLPTADKSSIVGAFSDTILKSKLQGAIRRVVGIEKELTLTTPTNRMFVVIPPTIPSNCIVLNWGATTANKNIRGALGWGTSDKPDGVLIVSENSGTVTLRIYADILDLSLL